jgi:hypothetical protein
LVWTVIALRAGAFRLHGFWYHDEVTQHLQVELIGGLCCHEIHRRPLHRFGNRLRIAEVVLLSRVGRSTIAPR